MCVCIYIGRETERERGREGERERGREMNGKGGRDVGEKRCGGDAHISWRGGGGGP